MRKSLRVEPEVAVARFKAGEQTLVPLVEVARMFGMRPEDFKPFLVSGELTGYVLDQTPDGLRYRIGLDLQQVTDWMVKHNIGTGGKPLHAGMEAFAKKLTSEARWMAKTADGTEIILSEVFIATWTEKDWKWIKLYNVLNHGQCVRLWEMQGLAGPVPKSVTLYVERNDVDRMLKAHGHGR